MVHSRIREIRREKGLTLQQLGERCGSTAQTIGRLETGMRTLSINWINRIAKALEVESATLLILPEQGDVEIIGEVGQKGAVSTLNFGIISMRLMGVNPLALKIKTNMGEYRAGDKIVCEGHGADDLDKALGQDCLITLEDGGRCFAKLSNGSKSNTYTLFPIGNAGTVMKDCKILMAAPVITLIRSFDT